MFPNKKRIHPILLLHFRNPSTVSNNFSQWEDDPFILGIILGNGLSFPDLEEEAY
jgi:hypothetical protein